MSVSAAPLLSLGERNGSGHSPPDTRRRTGHSPPDRDVSKDRHAGPVKCNVMVRPTASSSRFASTPS